MRKIPLMSPSLEGNEQKYVADVISSSWIGGVGDYLDRFEREWAELCGARECVAAANGTVSLHLALLALGAGPGDEVIVPSLTYVATANAVRFVGAEPVFVDIDPVTWCIDPNRIEAAITRRTKGVMPVHLHGHPADMDAISKIGALYKMWTLSDAAQAHLATYKQRTVGSLADIESFSFHVGKIFTCGEGGALTLNDSRLAKWLRMVRGHGMDPERRFFHPLTAYNYRLTNIQAALLCAQLERRDEIVDRRRRLFQRYRTNLTGTSGVAFQQVASWAETCPWVFCLVIDQVAFGMTRDEVIQELEVQGIETRRFGIPLHTLPPFREQSRERGDECPVAEELSQTGMYLPSSTGLTDSDCDRICELIQTLARRSRRKCA